MNQKQAWENKPIQMRPRCTKCGRQSKKEVCVSCQRSFKVKTSTKFKGVI